MTMPLGSWPVSHGQLPRGSRGLGHATTPTSNRRSWPQPQEGGEWVARLTPGVATCRLKAALASVKQWRKDGADTPAGKTAPGKRRGEAAQGFSCSQSDRSGPSPSSHQGSCPHLPHWALSWPGHRKPFQKTKPAIGLWGFKIMLKGKKIKEILL